MNEQNKKQTQNETKKKQLQSISYTSQWISVCNFRCSRDKITNFVVAERCECVLQSNMEPVDRRASDGRRNGKMASAPNVPTTEVQVIFRKCQ